MPGIRQQGAMPCFFLEENMTVHVEDDHPGRYAWIETALQEVRAINYCLPEVTHPCPNCGCPVKYPLIAYRDWETTIIEKKSFIAFY